MSDNNDNGRSDGTRDSPRETRIGRSSTNTPTKPQADGDTDTGTRAGKESFTRSEWERLHSDPDPRADLGYEITPWEAIDTATDSEQLIFMPQNEELLRDDTFIVAEEDSLCDLGKQY